MTPKFLAGGLTLLLLFFIAVSGFNRHGEQVNSDISSAKSNVALQDKPTVVSPTPKTEKTLNPTVADLVTPGWGLLADQGIDLEHSFDGGTVGLTLQQSNEVERARKQFLEGFKEGELTRMDIEYQDAKKAFLRVPAADPSEMLDKLKSEIEQAIPTNPSLANDIYDAFTKPKLVTFSHFGRANLELKVSIEKSHDGKTVYKFNHREVASPLMEPRGKIIFESISEVSEIPHRFAHLLSFEERVQSK